MAEAAHLGSQILLSRKILGPRAMKAAAGCAVGMLDAPPSTSSPDYWTPCMLRTLTPGAFLLQGWQARSTSTVFRFCPILIQAAFTPLLQRLQLRGALQVGLAGLS